MSPARRNRILVGIAIGVLALARGPASAGFRPVALERDFDAGLVWQCFFGRNWRAFWVTPAEAPVFDLARIGGGLRARKTVGGFQTRALAFEAADGRSFTFRSLEKGHFVPGWLDWSPATRVLDDQASGNFPAAHLVAARLAHSLGIPMTEPILGVLPDDPRLADFRAGFAGLAGMLSEYPMPAVEGRPGSFGAVEIIDTAELWERARAGQGAGVDARAYLRARLLDWWVADFDRHPDQWRWARKAGDDRWWPLPEDHDHAFPRYEGLVTALARLQNPWLLRFDGEYHLRGLLRNSGSLDAWILAGLDRAQWEQEASAFVERARESEAIEAAISALPVAWQERAREEVAAVLRARLDGLFAFAMRRYSELARQVEIHGSDGDDAAELECRPDGELQLVFRRGEDPPLQRRLSPAQTRLVEIHWYGGRDRIARVGTRVCGVRVLESTHEPRLERGVPALPEARPPVRGKLPQRSHRAMRRRQEAHGRPF